MRRERRSGWFGPTPDRRSGLVALAVVVLVALAGCATGADPSMSGSSDPAGPQVAFDEATGGIAGLVVDDSGLPVSSARVALGDLVETADVQGRFTFSFMSPGSYRLTATAAGYDEARLDVVVRAGAATEVLVMLEPLPEAKAYHETGVEAGFIQCSLGTRYPVLPPYLTTVGACVLVDDRFMTSWEMPTLQNVTGLWIETTWTSTQLAGDGIETFWPLYVPDSSGYIGNFEGGDPLSDPIPESALLEWLDSRSMERDVCTGADPVCHLDGWHYMYANTLGDGYDVDVGLLLQQAYEDYVTVFHYGPLPGQFTALPDE